LEKRGKNLTSKDLCMKILLSGYHNPNFTNTMVYRDHAIKDLGHELISFEDRAFLLPGSVRTLWPALNGWDLERLNGNLIKTAQKHKPDICLIVGGHRTSPKAIKAMKALGIKIGLWTTDVPIDFRNILEGAPYYDHLFCAGSEALDIFKSKNLKNISWVPFGCDPKFHKPVSIHKADQSNKDIVFVGSYYPNRAKLLENLSDLNIGIWGPYWSKLDGSSPIKNKVQDIKMNYDEWVKIYNAAKIVIVVHYQDPKIACHQASPKLFEAMACRACVFSDAQRDAQSLFEDGRHVVFFKDPAELRSKINFYLNQDKKREDIARQGYEEVISKHTYQHRLKQIISTLKD
jgi:spore maturation protein CgeB